MSICNKATPKQHLRFKTEDELKKIAAYIIKRVYQEAGTYFLNYVVL